MEKKNTIFNEHPVFNPSTAQYCGSKDEKLNWRNENSTRLFRTSIWQRKFKYTWERKYAGKDLSNLSLICWNFPSDDIALGFQFHRRSQQYDLQRKNMKTKIILIASYVLFHIEILEFFENLY